ncbi:MAG: hypothetical protein JWO51_3884 [Rhodospirillales bacterium]|nr:hypothetical protein [Rhodospirillales bacterium]
MPDATGQFGTMAEYLSREGGEVAGPRDRANKNPASLLHASLRDCSFRSGYQPIWWVFKFVTPTSVIEVLSESVITVLPLVTVASAKTCAAVRPYP